jgi:ABC-type phosphate transport system substrate-binding protein
MRRAVICLAAAFVLSSAVSAAAQDLAVIVNKSNSVETISMAELRKIMLAQVNRWATDRHAISVLLTRSEQPVALKAVCGMSEKDFDVHMMRARFNGETGKAPNILASASKVKQAVAGTSGAIGFILASEVDGTVKVVKIGGLVPGQAGYPVSLK